MKLISLPVNSNGQHGNITSVFINVRVVDLPICISNSECNENLICNGDFEAIQYASAEPMSEMNITSGNTPDIYPLSPIILSPFFFCDYPGAGGSVPNQPTAQSTKFLGLGKGPNSQEAIFLKLNQTLVPGFYELSFLAYTGCATEANFLFSENRPCVNNLISPVLNVTTNCSGAPSYTPKQIVSIDFSPSATSANWQTVTQVFELTEEDISYYVQMVVRVVIQQVRQVEPALHL